MSRSSGVQVSPPAVTASVGPGSNTAQVTSKNGSRSRSRAASRARTTWSKGTSAWSTALAKRCCCLGQRRGDGAGGIDRGPIGRQVHEGADDVGEVGRSALGHRSADRDVAAIGHGRQPQLGQRDGRRIGGESEPPDGVEQSDLGGPVDGDGDELDRTGRRGVATTSGERRRVEAREGVDPPGAGVVERTDLDTAALPTGDVAESHRGRPERNGRLAPGPQLLVGAPEVAGHDLEGLPVDRDVVEDDAQTVAVGAERPQPGPQRPGLRQVECLRGQSLLGGVVGHLGDRMRHGRRIDDLAGVATVVGNDPGAQHPVAGDDRGEGLLEHLAVERPVDQQLEAEQVRQGGAADLLMDPEPLLARRQRVRATVGVAAAIAIGLAALVTVPDRPGCLATPVEQGRAEQPRREATDDVGQGQLDAGGSLRCVGEAEGAQGVPTGVEEADVATASPHRGSQRRRAPMASTNSDRARSRCPAGHAVGRRRRGEGRRGKRQVHDRSAIELAVRGARQPLVDDEDRWASRGRQRGAQGAADPVEVDTLGCFEVRHQRRADARRRRERRRSADAGSGSAAASGGCGGDLISGRHCEQIVDAAGVDRTDDGGRRPPARRSRTASISSGSMRTPPRLSWLSRRPRKCTTASSCDDGEVAGGEGGARARPGVVALAGAGRHAGTADHELAGHADRARSTVPVDDGDPRAGDGHADRDRGLAGLAVVEGRPDARFGRAVFVGEPAVRGAPMVPVDQRASGRLHRPRSPGVASAPTHRSGRASAW